MVSMVVEGEATKSSARRRLWEHVTRAAHVLHYQAPASETRL
jgi:hypothetical protein